MVCTGNVKLTIRCKYKWALDVKVYSARTKCYPEWNETYLIPSKGIGDRASSCREGRSPQLYGNRGLT